MTIIILDMIGKWDSGDNRHAMDIMKSLGIEYQHAEPQPMADQWKFSGVVRESIPEQLPIYLRVIEKDCN